MGSGTTLDRDTDGGALGVGIGWLASVKSMGEPGWLDDGCWLSNDMEFCLFIEPGAFTLETVRQKY